MKLYTAIWANQPYEEIAELPYPIYLSKGDTIKDKKENLYLVEQVCFNLKNYTVEILVKRP